LLQRTNVPSKIKRTVRLRDRVGDRVKLYKDVDEV